MDVDCELPIGAASPQPHAQFVPRVASQHGVEAVEAKLLATLQMDRNASGPGVDPSNGGFNDSDAGGVHKVTLRCLECSILRLDQQRHPRRVRAQEEAVRSALLAR